jgi:glycosyltransferase involved in cell wall biosynthesis
LKIAVVHDYVTQAGGAERVAALLARELGGGEIHTALYDPDSTFDEYSSLIVHTSFLQRFSAFRRDARLALPLMPAAMASLASAGTLPDADVALCSSSGWAHGLGTTSPRVVYCHNPARWIYQSQDYLLGQRGLMRASMRTALKFGGAALRSWDQNHARTADLYIANSTSVAARVERVYGFRPPIVHPPITVDPDGEQEALPDLDPGYLLAVARPRGYKNVALLESVVQRLPGARLAIVGLTADASTSQVRRLGRVSDAQLRWLYSNAMALVSLSHEDFGLTPIEANAFGTPAVVLRAGGFLDTVVDGVNGVFVDTASEDALLRALRRLSDVAAPDAIRAGAGRFSPAAFVRAMSAACADVHAAQR